MLTELFLKNRSCRSYDESYQVTREQLCDMVECARLAPSSVNMQPLCYKLVYSREELEKVQPLTKWAGMLKDRKLPPKGHCPTGFIVICQDTLKFGPKDRFLKDVGICALAIQLKACEMGLAGCMIGSFDALKMKEALKLPEGVEPLLVVAVGKSDETCCITEVKDNDTRYYRDENNVHYVPKRALSDIVF